MNPLPGRDAVVAFTPREAAALRAVLLIVGAVLCAGVLPLALLIFRHRGLTNTQLALYWSLHLADRRPHAV